MTDNGFRDAVAVVTGGARGLGRTIVERLARSGCIVVIADVDGAAAEALVAELAKERLRTASMVLDVTAPGQGDRLTAEVLQRYGRYDYLVNNAGVLGPISPLWEVDDGSVQKVLSVNVFGVFSLTRAAARAMMKQKAGSIVTIASTAGKEGPAMLSPYAASKGAVIAATKSWAKELAIHGVRVNCVSPTLIEGSGMQAEMTSSYSSQSVEKIPMGRPAKLEEVAAVVAFLLSKEASFVTGQCYDVSGGRSVY